MSYEEEDTCMSYEEEDTCMSHEEEDTCMSHEEEDTCLSHEEESIPSALTSNDSLRHAAQPPPLLPFRVPPRSGAWRSCEERWTGQCFWAGWRCCRWCGSQCAGPSCWRRGWRLECVPWAGAPSGGGLRV